MLIIILEYYVIIFDYTFDYYTDSVSKTKKQLSRLLCFQKMNQKNMVLYHATAASVLQKMIYFASKVVLK